MTEAERQKYRQRLITLAKQVVKDVVDLKDEIEHPLAELPGQFSELKSEQAEQDISQALLVNEQTLSTDIRSALERLKDGTFGKCVKCLKSISQDRLNAIPYTPYCIQCA